MNADISYKHFRDRMTTLRALAGSWAVVAAIAIAAQHIPGDPLPSWHDGPSRKAIVSFVERVTKSGTQDFVPIEQRIAVFDNDGTLWSEQPMYVQAAFAIDRTKMLASKHPEWSNVQPFKGVLEGDASAVAASVEKGAGELMAATHSGMTTEEFEGVVSQWIAEARHPRFKRPYTDLIFLPMLELLQYLRANGFQTWIVSGGGIDFMRPWTERVYGIPPERVVGSSVKLRFELRGSTPALVRLPEVHFVDDGPGKPAGIQYHIGRRPIAAFGNSDGDLQMLQWVTSGSGPRLGLIVRHTDADREWAYDRDSHIGKLSVALDEAPSRGWIVADMAREWKVIYPFQKK